MNNARLLVLGAATFRVVVAARTEMKGRRGLRFKRALGSEEDSRDWGRVK